MQQEPIAITGIGCRFPGGADTPETFWHLLRDGVDAITEVPGDRFDINPVFDPRPGTPGKLCTRWGGFLPRVDQFDPYFFGISPREATRMDPQQRLVLEVAWEALEDAGQQRERLTGSKTGVFVGMCTSDYGDMQIYCSDPASIDIYANTGSARSVLAGRISYVFGLQGPSVVMDTACSSSLVAVHLACQSLRNGECGLALAGGVNLILSPEASMGFAQAKMLTPDGRCKAFDARADGFVRSDGVGIVALKPLSRALSDNDPVYAIIRGSAVNNDGRSGGLLMAPSSRGQEAVLREAYRSSGITPEQVHYVECHGTGTSVGDPVELEALTAVFSEKRPKGNPCRIGTVKTNIGHTEGAAGIAGLIKVALSLKHYAIPPSLHVTEPNPAIPWEDISLKVQQECEPWPVYSGPARAAVSSFGISGTNAHVVLEEAPRSLPSQEKTPATSNGPQLLTLSAHNPETLEALAGAYREFITSGRKSDLPLLRDICYTAGARRTHHDHRLATVISSKDELAGNLQHFLQQETCPGMSIGRKVPGCRRKLVFVFPGQGSQWIGMGRELLEKETVFRGVIESCDQAMEEYCNWSLLEKLAAPEQQSRFDEVDIIQPTIFAVQVALAALWRSWGIVPDAVVGQSMGEVAAAHVAGVFSLKDAARIICLRSQLVKSTSGQGSMAVVGLSLEDAGQVLNGHEDQVSVAVSNSPSSTVLSGKTAALQEIKDTVEAQDIFFRWINVDYASHCPQMESLRSDLLRALENLRPQPSSIPLYSTVLNKVIDGRECDAGYWMDNLRKPVLFWPAVQRLLEEKHDIFLEISPHPVLLSAIQQGLLYCDQQGTVLPSLRRNEGELSTMLGSLGALYTQGHPVEWDKLYPAPGHCVRLPSYPWQRERFWREEEPAPAGRPWDRFPSGGQRKTPRNPLLGHHLQPAIHPESHIWETQLSKDALYYLDEHRVQGKALLPAAAYAVMVMAAAAETFGLAHPVLKEVTFERAFFLKEAGSQTVQIVLTTTMDGEVSFRFLSYQAGEEPYQGSWIPHAAGTIHLNKTETFDCAGEHLSPREIQARCPELISGTEHYQSMLNRGLQYGPCFQGIDQLWRRDGEALGKLGLPEMIIPQPGVSEIHPTLLDSCFQVLEAALPGTDGNSDTKGTYLPVALESLKTYRSLQTDTPLWGHAVLRSDLKHYPDSVEGDVYLIDGNGQVILEASGLRMQLLAHDTTDATEPNYRGWFYELCWEEKPRPRHNGLPDQPGSWLIFTDSGQVGKNLESLLTARGETCFMASPGNDYHAVDKGHYLLNPTRPEEFQKVLDDLLRAGHPPFRGVLHLWNLEIKSPDETTPASLDEARELGCISILHLVQSLAQADRTHAPRLYLVTRGAQALGTENAPVSCAQSPVWGLGRVISNEHPELRCTKIDLDPASPPGDIQALFQELWLDKGEDQIILRDKRRYVSRLTRSTAEPLTEKRYAPYEGQPFRLEVSTPGMLDNLVLRETGRQKPGPGEVEIEVLAAGLNFSDVMKAMGIYPGLSESLPSLGIECAGRIVARGEGVQEFRTGDEVVAIAPCSFGRFVTAGSSFVVPKPVHLSFEEAATIPIAFLTAYYALSHLGKLSKGERVLIHSASGGVGLAAVQLSRLRGAEILATAGSPEKREFLQSQGIKHVMDSRSLAFASEVMEQTDGQGIDIVLNSLTGEAISRGLSILKPYGRFLELGKKDIYQNSRVGLEPFKKNLSFSAVDLDRVFRERPLLVTSLFREVMDYFEDGTLRPLPHKTFSISEAEGAFRYMAQAKHIGKIVLSLNDPKALIRPLKDNTTAFRSEATYLITGGLGGLGLSVAHWMVMQGVRHLVLIGRSGASAAAQETVDSMRKTGAQVVAAKADVAQKEQVATVLNDIAQSMPPLRGIIHAAGILDDGILLQLDQERFKKVMAPKISGAWNLHTLTLDAPLDFFVLFSSAASLLGSPGQGNYVAGNSFLDALAHYRRMRGLPALAINWGPWSEVGLASRPDRGGRLAFRGFESITQEQGVEVLGQLLRQDSVQVGVMPVKWAQWQQFYPDVGKTPFFTHVVQEQTGAKEAFSYQTLLSAKPEDRRELMISYLREQIARVLGISGTKLSKIDTHQPLNTLGIDSLMAVEIKNRVVSDIGITVPIVNFLQGPTIRELAADLLNQLPTGTAAEKSSQIENLLDSLEEISEEEAKAMLEGNSE